MIPYSIIGEGYAYCATPPCTELLNPAPAWHGYIGYGIILLIGGIILWKTKNAKGSSLRLHS